VALITGASRGIGQAMAEVFSRAGAKLALVARTASQLEEVARSLAFNVQGLNVLTLPADVAEEAQVNGLVEEIVETWGRVDILINNAGLITFGPIAQVEPADWARVIGANLTGPYLLSRAVAPLMMEQKYGRIINIASISAQTGGVSAGVDYSASKGGMLALTKTLARDLAPYGVTVNAIAPGQIDADPHLLTPEARQRIIGMVPLGRLGEPEEVAYAALFLASPMAAYITGATLDVNGGILRR
jgi:3-oxoacyl-[acyl-carrier protein] reductase